MYFTHCTLNHHFSGFLMAMDSTLALTGLLVIHSFRGQTSCHSSPTHFVAVHSLDGTSQECDEQILKKYTRSEGHLDSRVALF